MNEIICPHCKKAFKIDEAGYADILKQVRDHLFEEELKTRMDLAEQQHISAIKLAEATVKNELQVTINQKDQELLELRNIKEKELLETQTKSERKILELQAKIDQFETNKQLEMSNALKAIENENVKLTNELEKKELEKENIKSSLTQKYTTELNSKNEIIKYKDEEIARVKDMKTRLSTKMIGESLEQYCETEFNKIRSMAFPKAYFEKDNDAKSGSKGDFIFREFDEQNNEIVSIMFEMKNEAENTTTKKKNEDFLKELDKDRLEKKCEFAVLVTMLEADSDLYNAGIVDVSYKFPKMYVVRPQFFIPIITLLRNAALNTLKYKAELALVKNQNIDITNFEEKMNKFKDGFARNYDLASKKFKEAIEGIDKTITQLQKTREALVSSENNLRLANNKTEELTIKRLTHGNPTMKAKFDEISSKNEQNEEE